MKNFVEFITSNLLRNFIFEFAKAYYESHVQKLTICSSQKN